MRAKQRLALAGVGLCGVLLLLALWRDWTAQFPVPATQPAMVLRRSAPAATQRQSYPESRREETVWVKPARPATVVRSEKPLSSATPPGASKAGKPPIQDAVARQALAWVGYDEAAEAYWVQAINDPSLPAQERQDLIEDLNEDGLSDPKHPTLEDLPLILNRLELIELLAPDAMDEVNADAFMEAYKDLVNLTQVAAGGGEPVK